MLPLLPTMAPRDSHSLWYTSNHQSHDGFILGDASAQAADAQATQHFLHLSNSHLRRSQVARSPLAQLRADEQYMERRKLNVQNYGSSWMKPPGVFRSLHQIREEEREMKEHAEAMRREQLAQELAEAEAVEELMDDDLMETRNLDDDIPDQDDLSASEEDDDSDDSDDERNEARVPSVMVQHISEDMYTEAVIQGDSFGAEGGLNPTDEDRSQMFEEDDIAHDDTLNMNVDLDMDVDMDGDLDGSVLDGEISGYEHTDTDDELTSSEADSDSS